MFSQPAVVARKMHNFRERCWNGRRLQGSDSDQSAILTPMSHLIMVGICFVDRTHGWGLTFGGDIYRFRPR